MKSAPRTPLPIDEVLDEIVARLRAASSLVIEAPPGAGKTTRVPWALIAGEVVPGEVIVLEPRRLAARLAARRVAEECGERVGETVGYTVRFDEVASARTRLRFVTQGVLLRRLLAEPGLPGVGAVVLDEFHERSLEGDLALALLAQLQRESRPELRLVVMSATLDAEPVARFLAADRVRSEGRRFDVAIEYAALEDARPLDQQVASAVRRLADGGLDGHVLVFLPGAAEIRKAQAALAPVAARADLALVTLHGDQSPAEQDAALASGARRKVILATNVAETSVTIEGVVAVVDSGLARLAAHSPWSGLPSLRVGKISRASATQRAGRAGRTRPGKALRLYTRHDHDSRAEFETPEVRRADLADASLLLHASGLSPRGLGWFEPPPVEALAAAETLLARLHALDAKGALTELGRRMARLPLHPRLARLVCEGDDRGVALESARVAAVLGEGRRPPAGRDESGPSDVLAAAERIEAGSNVERVSRLLVRACRRAAPRPASPGGPEEAVCIAILAAFPDRVARRRRAGQPEVLLCGGRGEATLARASVVRDAELMVVVEAEERRERGAAQTLVHTASAIEPEWLLDLYPEWLRDVDEPRFEPKGERVECVRQLLYDGLVIEESRANPPAATDERAWRVLYEAARARGPASFADADELERFRNRVAFVAGLRPDAGLVLVDDAALAAALERLCVGRRAFSDLKGASLIEALRETLGPAGRGLVDKLAPERVTLPGGRGARVDYHQGQPPSLASRLQDFFGMAEGPRVGGGAVPVTLHLLAPNQRAVQVTTDLAGFWVRHYPALRKELMRRYPRHAWPEDGRTATPPTGGRPR